jgi:hypothetical protein
VIAQRGCEILESHQGDDHCRYGCDCNGGAAEYERVASRRSNAGKRNKSDRKCCEWQQRYREVDTYQLTRLERISLQDVAHHRRVDDNAIAGDVVRHDCCDQY